jgi:hypothetical protein
MDLPDPLLFPVTSTPKPAKVEHLKLKLRAQVNAKRKDKIGKWQGSYNNRLVTEMSFFYSHGGGGERGSTK